MRAEDLQELIRRAFLAGYDAGLNERDEQDNQPLPDNVTPLRGRGAHNRKEQNA